ncbi:unnamed protein product [Diatraea saccharalis]|uniref:Uncharacterized protein n=1 Tax=Diatraea saccharalis TaxID=40085 RepID=A0A9N9RAB8_9NEOP|nr:unnamed protein product [Diatraea saccharalis]
MGELGRQSAAGSPQHAIPPAPAPASAPAPAPAPDAHMDSYHHQPMGMSGVLSAAQSQYLSQLTQQSQRHDNSVYTTNYGVYASSDVSGQRKPQRARVPPPSKRPAARRPSPPAALYTAGVGGVGGGYAYEEAQLMRGGTTLPHHMGGYYEVGYGGSVREGGFGLGAADRFSRTDAASPQQVPAALPPGYAYFYQPPPTTYQYGVYPTYGGGSSVGGVGGVGGVTGVGGVGGVGGVSGVGGVGSAAAGKVSTYTPQQPPYDAQDSYKPAGGYSAGAGKAQGQELAANMYKGHVALNKVNSYEKAGFHSGTPPPFGASHLYIPAPHHHHHLHSQHQMDVRVNNSHSRRESGAGAGGGGGRSSAAKPPPTKPSYSQSYWTPN